MENRAYRFKDRVDVSLHCICDCLLQNMVDFAMTTPLQDEVVTRAPLQLLTDLLSEVIHSVYANLYSKMIVYASDMGLVAECEWRLNFVYFRIIILETKSFEETIVSDKTVCTYVFTSKKIRSLVSQFYNTRIN